MNKGSKKKSSWKFALGVFVFCFISSIFGMVNTVNATEDKSMTDGFTIEEYRVILDVNENNIVNVREYITVDWKEGNHYGIYKLIPQWLEYTGKDGKTIKRKSIVSDVVSLSIHYSTSIENGKVKVKLGDTSQYVPLGEKTYSFSYIYDMGEDPFEGFDEFIFHAFGDYWEKEIKNASIQINMPKDISKYTVNFFTDKYREENVNRFVDYEVSGNTLYAKLKSSKKLEKSLTVDIELPEGYFVGGNWNYGWVSFSISCIIIIVTIYTAIQWRIYGKNFPKKCKTIEFYPPDNFSAVEIGYIIGKQTKKKLLISLMLQLATKGYIKIDDLKDGDIQITNLCVQSSETANINRPVLKPLTESEKKIYDKLFEEQNVVILSQHKTLYQAYEEVEKTLVLNLRNLIVDQKSDKKLISSIVISIIITFLHMLSYYCFEDLDPKFGFLYGISFVCIMINYVFTAFMGRNTQYGEEIKAKVEGFRETLQNAQKADFEALVSQNPQYFYDILPYAFLFNISKTWIRKFDNIQMPYIDMGSFNYASDQAYYTFNQIIYFPSNTSSNHYDSSNSGGGCSSCGGGCSSCGGGGSW